MLVAIFVAFLLVVIIVVALIEAWVQGRREKLGCKRGFGICEKGDDGYCARCHSEMY